MDNHFYLASRSERRVQMLRHAGFRFGIVPADIDERALADESPADFAARMALEKALAIRARGDVDRSLPVLGADTDVALDGSLLGKPRDRQDAVGMLLRLSGRTHQVHSAVAVELHGHHRVVTTCTEVVFGPVSPGDAEAYWATGEPADKAGAYAIQGLASRWVREIRGSYSGVVGLPLCETVDLLRAFGVHPEWPA
ncbi:MAG: Maf family protein [Panacagrimonas sp.]